MCDFNGCHLQAIYSWRCDNSGHDTLICHNIHAPVSCPQCGGPGTIVPRSADPTNSSPAPSGNLLAIQSVVSGVTDALASASNSMDISDPSPIDTAGCPHAKVPRIGWCTSINDMVVPVQICQDKTVLLGHSMGAMAERERYLREESGVRVRQKIAHGPNNALCELRLLLVDKRCNSFQVAIRFRDEQQRHLLFRSTGGSVLQRDPENPRNTKLRSHNTRCTAVSGYLAAEEYVHAGAYSFFTQDFNAVSEPRLQTPEKYREHHDGEYRSMMRAGRDDQLFHHSEQAVFKLLYDYPNVVAEALERMWLEYPMSFAHGPLRLAALAVDIFTTRSACANCTNAATVSKSSPDHFFVQMIEAAKEKTSLAGKVEINETCKYLVRIGCATEFTGCPSTPSVNFSAASILHALPADFSGSEILPDEPNIIFLNVAIPCNVPSSLLTTGSASREQTAVEIAIRQYRELSSTEVTRDQIPKVVKSLPLELPANRVMVALHYLLNVEKDPAQKWSAPVYGEHVRLLPFLTRMQSLWHLSSEVKINPPTLFSIMLRNYRKMTGGLSGKRTHEQVFDLMLQCMSLFVQLRTESLGWPLEQTATTDATDKAAVLVADHYRQPFNRTKFLNEFATSIHKEMKVALTENSASGENRARNLAIDFGQMDFYQKCINEADSDLQVLGQP